MLRSHGICGSATDLPVAQWSLKHHSAVSEGWVPLRALGRLRPDQQCQHWWLCFSSRASACP